VVSLFELTELGVRFESLTEALELAAVSGR
jgi:hypothetical protein